LKIDNFKDLERVIKLCRKAGVDSIKIDNVEFHLGAEPYSNKPVRKQIKAIEDMITSPITPGGITEDTRIDTDGLTEEQLLFYSARPESFEDNPTQ